MKIKRVKIQVHESANAQARKVRLRGVKVERCKILAKLYLSKK